MLEVNFRQMKRELKKLIGSKARWVWFFRTIRAVPFKLQLPVFGTVSSLDEILNIHDNFGKAELRNPEIEDHLRATPNPVIVDCGVNIGITVRWWHHLNPQARVFGFDMMEEAHSFTKSRLDQPADWYIPTTCALAAKDGDSVQLSFDEPLFGENSVDATNRKHARTVRTGTLDARLSHYHVKAIDLLKIDIEGYGAEALKGAHRTLDKTRYVMFETHSRVEISEASRILMQAGFDVVGTRARTLVFERLVATTSTVAMETAEVAQL